MFSIVKKVIVSILNVLYSCFLLFIRILEVIGQLLPENKFGCQVRGLMYKPFLRSCGNNFQVALNVKLENLKKISVGDNVYIGYGSWLNGHSKGIILEDNVMLGPYVTIVANNHTNECGSFRFGKGEGETIIVDRNVWLASKVSVISGSYIGKDSLIAANSVVVKDVYSNSLYAGIPAKKIKEFK